MSLFHPLRASATQPPVAIFAYSPELPTTNDIVTFNASESYDPDGKIVSYVWDFGDGNITTVTDAIITHAYSAEGGYIVTSTVVDSIGLKDESSMVVRTAGREDINDDGKVDMLDISLVIDASMTYPGDSRWDPRCDANLDGVVDMLDVSMVIEMFGAGL